jgi:hypothetical protein
VPERGSPRKVEELLAKQPVRVALGDDAVAPAHPLAPVEQHVQEPDIAVGGEGLGPKPRGGEHLVGSHPKLRGDAQLRGRGNRGRERELHRDDDLQIAHPKLGAGTKGGFTAAAQKLRALAGCLAQERRRLLDTQPPHAGERLLDVRGGPEQDL